MGRMADSIAGDASTIRQSSFSTSSKIQKIHPSHSTLRHREPSGHHAGSKMAFEMFAEVLRQELAPGSLLERVLIDRVILSAWTLQTASEKEFATIRHHLPSEGRGGDSDRRSSTSSHGDAS